jgi:cell division protein FtsL
MIARFLHLTVVAALIVAAAYVYKIKFESTVRAAEVARLAAEIKRQRDAIAALKAEWAQLENPARIQGLADRHLPLRILDPAQIDRLDRLPERPAPAEDAIATMIDALEAEGGIVPPIPPAAGTSSSQGNGAP